ncbi:PREDICTED: uncharacterized protein LOC107098629 isoform X2 [Cyprinodon variegatus]|uniref:uncharacterized protein LOC107098629 isoform X2 n=1 Tax=Cyprinodon variegatus TaxID=28743 RepID=UPI0007427E1B|nr:PREDICTED: uncharacterized protein LOC107098629 isoform X2 [Cyprinodon variegatus]
MRVAVELLLLLLGVSQGLAADCDGRINKTRCNVTVGETLFLRLANNASEIPKFDLQKGQSILLRWRINATVTNQLKDRSDFIYSNGTFRINKVRPKDGGEYELQIFGSDGIKKETRYLHLSVQGEESLKIGVIAAVACFAFCLFSLMAIQVLRKKQKVKEEEDPDHLTYADITIAQEPGKRQVKQKLEEEVEYGQIKSSG